MNDGLRPERKNYTSVKLYATDLDAYVDRQLAITRLNPDPYLNVDDVRAITSLLIKYYNMLSVDVKEKLLKNHQLKHSQTMLCMVGSATISSILDSISILEQHKNSITNK